MDEQRECHSFWLIIAIAVLVISTLSCGSSTTTSEPPKISTATSQSVVNPPVDTQASVIPTNSTIPASPTETPVTELYLGDTAQGYGYALTAVKVADPAKPGSFYQAETGKKLVAVEVIISNLSGDDLSVNSLNAISLDTEAYKYTSELFGIDNELATVDLSKGEQIQGWISFKVPENATLAKIMYSLGMFSDSVLQTSLTPPPAGHSPVNIAMTLNPPVSKLGDVVEQNGYSLTVMTVEDPTNPGMFYQARDGFRPIAIEIILANISGASSLSVNTLYTYLVDNKGYVYSPELMGRTGDIATVDLNVSEKARGWVTFVIPNASIPAYVKYQTEPFSSNYLVAGAIK
jgi:hypothetical protein